LVQDLGDRPDERGVAKRIVSSVVRLNAIVGDVLAFSRELSLRAEAVDIAALMHESIESCRARAEERGVELRWWAPPDDGSGPGEPMGDAGLLRQALVNIVSNAVDAAADGGCDARIVEVSAHTATIRDAEGGRAPAVSLRVDDSGAGIPSEVRERMFNPFFTTRETGTGLGLAIVHRIVDAHGGAIVIGDRGVGGGDGDGAGSWPGGARVEIKLPLAVAAGRGAGEGGGAVSLVEGKGRGGARRPAGAAVEVKSGAGHGSRLGGTVPSEAGGVGGSAGRAPESCSKEGQA
jgi:signal transduction histidine kinase